MIWCTFLQIFLIFHLQKKKTNSEHSSESVTDETKKHVALCSTVISSVIIGPSYLIYLMFTNVNKSQFLPLSKYVCGYVFATVSELKVQFSFPLPSPLLYFGLSFGLTCSLGSENIFLELSSLINCLTDTFSIFFFSHLRK